MLVWVCVISNVVTSPWMGEGRATQDAVAEKSFFLIAYLRQVFMTLGKSCDDFAEI